eukprot:COSAG05_NODE_191_length_14617_cov_90.240736_11_plen_153_part_00
MARKFKRIQNPYGHTKKPKPKKQRAFNYPASWLKKDGTLKKRYLSGKGASEAAGYRLTASRSGKRKASTGHSSTSQAKSAKVGSAPRNVAPSAQEMKLARRQAFLAQDNLSRRQALLSGGPAPVLTGRQNLKRGGMAPVMMARYTDSLGYLN